MSAPGRTAGRAAGLPVAGRTIGRGRAIAVVQPPIPGRAAGGDRYSPAERMIGVEQKSPPDSPQGSTPEVTPGGSPRRSESPASIDELANTLERAVRVKKDYGKQGMPVDVEVNYVKVHVGKRSGPYLYHVRFTPDIDSIKIRRAIMWRDQKVVDKIGAIQEFTGMNLYLPKVLPQQITEIQTHHPNDPSKVIQVVIEYLKEPPLEELIPFYNTILRRAMNTLELVQIKHHYYNAEHKITIPQHKLEVWPGSISKIVELDEGLLLCCEITHRVLRTTSALQLLMDIFRRDRNNFVANAKKHLVGAVVLTKYNNKPYRIDDIDFTGNPASTFTKNDGTVISYAQYFNSNWNETITDMRQPLLIHSPKPRKGETETRIIVLVPELCFMTGLTDEIRSDFRAMRDIAQHTRMRPEVRHAKLLQYLHSIANNPPARKVFEDWNIKLDQEPYLAKARILLNETLMFGQGREVQVKDDVSWSREATGTACFASFHLKDWVIIVPVTEEAKAREVFQCLQQVTQPMGFKIEVPKRHAILDDSAASYVKAIRAAVTPSTQLVFLVTPGASQREDRYNAIKKLTCCEMSVPSQVLRSATVGDQKKMKPVCQKIALQMQCKIGGQPWVVSIPFKTAMFVGIDVFHDKNRQAKSCVAMVASMNSGCSRWYTRVFFQGTSEEISHSLRSGMKQCARKFAECTGTYPERVFIFRDGVGDGQVPLVRDYEVPQMKAALTEDAPEGVQCKVTTLIVQKRVDARMLLRRGTEFNNPRSGTVLDRGITRVNFSDFFLISQHVTQGTVTPTHYIEVINENGLPMDKMQRLTYRMTFLYYNWPGCVRVPSPCQYAHKVAYLAGENLGSLPQDSLCDKLFFL
jgi:aubergine-like protein